MTRTLIALELDESLQRYLSEVIRHLALQLPGLRWVDPAGIHLTLAFLGELTSEQLAKALQASEEAAQLLPPFTFRLSSPGTFGSPRQPRFIWIGVDEPSGRLLQLHRLLNQHLEQQGFAVEKRPFSPHLTLSRIKSPLKTDELQSLQRLLAGKQFMTSSPIQYVTHLSVMKSELFPTGAKYTCLQQYALSA